MPQYIGLLLEWGNHASVHWSVVAVGVIMHQYIGLLLEWG